MPILSTTNGFDINMQVSSITVERYEYGSQLWWLAKDSEKKQWLDLERS